MNNEQWFPKSMSTHIHDRLTRSHYGALQMPGFPIISLSLMSSHCSNIEQSESFCLQSRVTNFEGHI